MTNQNTNYDYCKGVEKSVVDKSALVRLCGVLGVLTENNDLATAALLAATRIEVLEKNIPALNVDLAEASMHAYNGEIARMKLEAELARRDASLLTEGEQKEILSYIRGNYDRAKIPYWLLDLIDEIDRLTEKLALTEKKLCNVDSSARVEVKRLNNIIARLKEAGENLIQLANFGNKRAIEYIDLWSALMKELNQTGE